MKKLLLVLGVVLLFAGCGNKAESYMEKAREYYEIGQYDYASYNYIKVLELDYGNKKAYLGLIDSYIMQERFDDAWKYLKAAEFKFGADKLEDRRAEIEKGILAAQPVNTPTPVPTATSTPTPTPTNTPVPTPTSIPIPMPTSTPVPTATSTPTPVPTSTPVPTATSTPTPTPTSTPTPTPTSISKPTPVVEQREETPAHYFEFDIVNNQVTITGVNGQLDEMHIPAYIAGYPVTKIEAAAFMDMDELIIVTMPDSVTVLDPLAFLRCNSLSAVTIPASVTRISTDTFMNCDRVCLIVEENSYAHDYAVANKMPYIIKE